MVFCLSCPTAATAGISALRPRPLSSPPYPTATHIPLSRLVLAATGNCDSGVWLARDLPPPRPGGQAGASLGRRQGPSHLTSKGLGPGLSSPQQGRHSTWILIGGGRRRTQSSSINHANVPTVCDGCSHFPGEEPEVQRACYTCPGSHSRTGRLGIQWPCSMASPGQPARWSRAFASVDRAHASPGTSC